MATGERDEVRDVAFVPGQASPGGIWSDGTNLWSVNDNTERRPSASTRIFAQRLPPSSEGPTTLSNLAVAPSPGMTSFTATLRPAFSYVISSYRVAVPNQAQKVTITPTFSESGAAATYMDSNGEALADADPGATGHQVNVPVGTSSIGIRVTKTGEEPLSYTVNVERDSALRYRWTPSKDLNNLHGISNNDGPRVVWGNNDTLYVGLRFTPKIFAFNRSDGSRNTERDIVINSDFPEGADSILLGGLWSDGTTMWVLDYVTTHDADGADKRPLFGVDRETGKLFAFSLVDDPDSPENEYGKRDKSKEFALDTIHNGTVRGIWSDGETAWVSDWQLAKLIAYSFMDDSDTPEDEFGQRQTDKDFTLHVDNNSAQGIWSNETTVWVADWEDDRLYAYSLADGLRDKSKEFDLHPGNHLPRDVWSDGQTIWVVQNQNKLYAYNLQGTELTVAFGSGTYTVVEGMTRSVTVTLNADPERAVVIPIEVTPQGGSSSDDYAGLPENVTFNAGERLKTITFEATQDIIDDDDESVKLGFGTLPPGVSEGTTGESTVTITDDDDAAIVLSKSSLEVDEGDSIGASYTVSLSSEPTAEVTVTITGQASTDLTLDKSSLTFTTSNWSTAQTVTVTAAQDDDAEDDTVPLTHTAAGGDYAGLTAELEVTVDDSAGLVLSEETLEPDEGGIASYTVSLSSEPTAEVTVTITGQASTDLTLDKSSLTFTTSNWSTAQTVTVTAAQDDDAEDDTVPLTHTAAGGDYAGLTAELEVTIDDDDSAGLVLSEETLEPDEGGIASYMVSLSSEPTAEVTVTITGQASTDLTLDKSSLTFTTSNWSTAQTVTVTAAQDDDAEDDTVPLTHTAAGGDYAGLTVELEVTIDDDDSAGLVLSEETLEPDEGGIASYTVSLSSEPTAEVTVTITGQASTDLTLDKSSLTFTTSNWSTAQTVTVTAAQDDDAEDDTVPLTHTAAGGDYTGLTAELEVTIDDDGSAGLVLSEETLEPDEGGTASYMVSLSSEPTAEVTVTITGQASTDLTLDKSSLTFTTSNWSTAQTVTVTAAQDDDAEDDTVPLTHTAAGGDYAGLTAELEVTIDDDGSAGLVLSEETLEPDEGGTASYMVSLSSEPTAEVTVTITGQASTDLTLDKSSLTFTTSNWSTAQTVTVTAAQDDDAEDDTVPLTHTAAGGDYAGLTAELEVTIDDDDRPHGFSLDCDQAIWCAELQLADYTALDWAWLLLLHRARWDPPSTLSNQSFLYQGVEYTIRHVNVFGGIFPGMDNTWAMSQYENASFEITVTTGPAWYPPPSEHWQNWVLHVDSLILPFSHAQRVGSSTFSWSGSAFQQFFSDWTDSTITYIGIKQEALPDQPPQPLPAPRMVHVWWLGASHLHVRWNVPRDVKGAERITGFNVQWKLATDDWSNGAAVSETRVDAGRTRQWVTLTGLVEDSLYSVRVIATSSDAQERASYEVLAKPQSDSPQILSNVVDGRTLTMRFDRHLNAGAVPSTDSFVVLVNGGMREVDSASIVSSGASGYQDDAVQLTLAIAVSAVDIVEGSYFAPSDPAATFLQDIYGRFVPSPIGLKLHDVANETDRATLQPLTAQFTNVPASHDGESSITFNIEFSESVWVGHGFPRDDMLEVTGGTVTSAHWLDRNTKKWAVTIRPETQGDIGVVLPKNRYCVSLHSDGTREGDLVLGAPCAVEDRQLTNQPEATIPGPSSQNQAVNSPATGGPGIDGFLRAGETLTATTTAIQDEDGMTGAVFAYQWIRRDLATATDTDIAGATGSTYTVTTGDEGKGLMARVTFIDDAGNEESLTSFAVIISPPLVIPDDEPANTPATGSPGIDGSPVVGQTLTATTSDIRDDDGIVDAAFAYQWLADDAAIGGASASTYTVVAGDVGKALKVRVTFTDDVGNEESLTSAPTAAVTQPLLTAAIRDAPESHDGRRKFTFELRFSEEFPISYKTLRDHAFTVTGGEVTKARRLERGKNIRWEIHVRPNSNAAVTILLPVTTDCDAQGAVCTNDGRMLSGRLELTVSGPSG